MLLVIIMHMPARFKLEGEGWPRQFNPGRPRDRAGLVVVEMAN
jgi:hypothetical protein